MLDRSGSKDVSARRSLRGAHRTIRLARRHSIHRQCASHAYGSAGIAWRISLADLMRSHGLAGIQLAASWGLSVTVLPELAMLEGATRKRVAPRSDLTAVERSP